MIIDKIKEELENSSKIYILPHMSIDADALGASIALAKALRMIKKEVTIFVEETPSKFLNFMFNEDEIIVYDENVMVESSDIVFAVDSGDIQRLGKRALLFHNTKFKINVDHHITNTKFGDINLVLNVSSTCEIIHQIIKHLGVDIDEYMSNALYTGIALDTGGFKYSNTSSNTHMVVADLINSGASVSKVTQNVFEKISLNKFYLMSDVINSTRFYKDGKITVVYLSKEILSNRQGDESESSGLSGFPITIEGVEVSIFIVEKKDNKHKLSLRSKNLIDVCKIATEYGGGGHIRAAGFTYDKEIDKLINELVKNISKQFV